MAEHKQGAETDRANTRRTLLGIATVLLISCGMVILLADRKKPSTVTVVLEPTGKGPEGLDATAVYDPATGEFKIKLTNFRPPANKDYELWMLRENRGPKSLGLVSGLGMVKGNAPGATGFALSLEPKGGATPRGGPPTGPVVCTGKLAPWCD